MIEITSTPIIITILLATAGLAIPVIDAIRKEKVSNSRGYGIFAFAVLVISLAYVIFRLLTGETLPSMAFSDSVLTDDAFGSFFAIALLIVSIMVTVSSWSYLKGRTNAAAYYSLILLSSIGMIIIAYSTDYVMLLISWELMSIPTYALAAFSKRDPISNEAAIKYFMFGALSTAILVLGIGFIYGITGTTNIGESVSRLMSLDPELVPLAILAIALFIAGFGFKMGLVPFHMWLPDTYEGAPTTIGALLAAGTKKAGFAAAIRVIVVSLIAMGVDWAAGLAVLAIFTMTVGNLGALVQKSVPRILAYSSIAQAGYIMIGISLAQYSEQAMTGTLFHILNHAVMKSAAFIAAASVVVALAGYGLEQYRGLGRRMPITAIVLAISLLALAGVPPLNGFWSKLVLFQASINSGPLVEWGPYLAIAGVLNSALSLGYYAWIIRKMYMEDAPDMKRIKEPLAIVGVLIFAVVFIVVFGIWHAPLLEFSSNILPDFNSTITNIQQTFPR